MDFSIAAAGTGPVVIDISPKALGPTRGLGAVLGRYALKKPGDCGQARRNLDATKADESQDTQPLTEKKIMSGHSETLRP